MQRPSLNSKQASVNQPAAAPPGQGKFTSVQTRPPLGPPFQGKPAPSQSRPPLGPPFQGKPSGQSNAAVASSIHNRSGPLATSQQARTAPSTAQRRPIMGNPSAVSRDDLKPCRTCGRRFVADRIGVHETICVRTGEKKRKPFDPKMHRLQGTPAEGFQKMTPRGKPGSAGKSTPSGLATSNWRAKHDDFINTIRAAKQMKAHMAQGGKLADLPPPPRGDYSDYINCPHCGRNFNQQAAERHIPKCATMEHNKPKKLQSGPTPAKKR